MAINLDDIVKQATAGTDSSSTQAVEVASGSSAKTKSGAGSIIFLLTS